VIQVGCFRNIPRHDPFGHLYLRTIMIGHLLSCCHLVHHSASFLSPLMPPPPCHPILGRGRESRRLLPEFVRHQPRHRPAQRLLHVHEDVSQHACTIIFAVVVRLSSFRPLFALFFLLDLLPPPTVAAASRPTLVDAGTGRVGLAPGLSPCVPPRRTR
jgi:hypothetical protein